MEQHVARCKAESKEERRGERFLNDIIGQNLTIQSVRQQIRKVVQEVAKKHGRPAPEVDLDIPDFPMQRAWAGNVRQLRCEVERAFVFAEDGRIRIGDFGQVGDPSPSVASRVSSAVAPVVGTSAGSGTLKEATDRLERELITDAMVRFKSNKKRVAAQLGVSRQGHPGECNHWRGRLRPVPANAPDDTRVDIRRRRLWLPRSWVTKP